MSVINNNDAYNKNMSWKNEQFLAKIKETKTFLIEFSIYILFHYFFHREDHTCMHKFMVDEMCKTLIRQKMGRKVDEVSQIVAFSRFRFIAYYTKMRGWISMNQLATNVYLKCPR